MSAYIVVFNAGVSKDVIAAVASDIEAKGGSVAHRYYEKENPILNGFAATIGAEEYEILKTNENIKYIEADAEVRIA